MSSKMKMGGFMCRSPTSTAVCLPGNMRSVIVPRKSRSTSVIDHEDVRLVRTKVKYSRIGTEDKGNKRRDMLMLPLAHHHKQDNNNQTPHFQLTPSSTHIFQVVVLRVSLHCHGCASKLKKHLSRMEGVTSFSIDLETRRVTVMGHVSPTGVLESISKVKRAEFWPPS